MEGTAGLHHRVQVPVRRSIHLQVWDSWDRYPIYAIVQEDEIAKYLPATKKKKEVDRMEAADRSAKIEFTQKKKMENGENRIEGHWDTIQKTVEDAAGKQAHNTKKTRATLQNKHRRM